MQTALPTPSTKTAVRASVQKLLAIRHKEQWRLRARDVRGHGGTGSFLCNLRGGKRDICVRMRHSLNDNDCRGCSCERTCHRDFPTGRHGLQRSSLLGHHDVHEPIFKALRHFHRSHRTERLLHLASGRQLRRTCRTTLNVRSDGEHFLTTQLTIDIGRHQRLKLCAVHSFTWETRSGQECSRCFRSCLRPRWMRLRTVPIEISIISAISS